MNTFVIRRAVPKNEEDRFLSEYAGFSDYDKLITEPGRFVDEDGNFLAIYAPAALASQFSEFWPELSSIQIKTDNRGNASGKNVRRMTKKTTRVNPNLVDWPYSGQVGSFDRSVRQPYCRQTIYTAEHREFVYGKLAPFWKAISSAYSRIAPNEYDAQVETCQKIHPDWLFPSAPFTTITVNNTYRTAYHRDGGDLVGPGVAWSLLVAGWEGGISGGAHIVLPSFRVAFPMAHGDFLCFNPHLIHGNTPIGSRKRVSCVCYIREKIQDCGSAEEERVRGSIVAERRAFGSEL
jgi:hypothetical protein